MELLFVCTGNTCRSAMAEAAAQKLINDAVNEYDNFTVDSAGVMCAGPSPASQYAILAAEQNQADLSNHTAKQVTDSLLFQADYIFTMTQGHKQLLERIAPQYRDKIFLLNAFAEGNPNAADIPDPYGSTLVEYLQCYTLIEASVAQILNKLR